MAATQVQLTMLRLVRAQQEELEIHYRLGLTKFQRFSLTDH